MAENTIDIAGIDIRLEALAAADTEARSQMAARQTERRQLEEQRRQLAYSLKQREAEERLAFETLLADLPRLAREAPEEIEAIRQRLAEPLPHA